MNALGLSAYTRRMSRKILFLAALFAPTDALARCIDPDPDQPRGRITCTVFTVDFAKSIRWAASISDIQSAAGAPGSFNPAANSWNWRGEDENRLSYMTATMRADGSMDVVVLADNDTTIAFNTRAGWNCRPEAACAPWRNTAR